MAEPFWITKLAEQCEKRIGTVEPGIRLHAGLVLEMVNMLRDARRVIAKETTRGQRSKRVKRWYLRYKKGPVVK